MIGPGEPAAPAALQAACFRSPHEARMKSFRTLVFVLTAALAGPALAADSAVVTTPQVRAELVAHAPDGVTPGKPLWLGLKIEHKPHWHTYWKNPGDSGLPTTLDWQVPAGV